MQQKKISFSFNIALVLEHKSDSRSSTEALASILALAAT